MLFPIIFLRSTNMATDQFKLSTAPYSKNIMENVRGKCKVKVYKDGS